MLRRLRKPGELGIRKTNAVCGKLSSNFAQLNEPVALPLEEHLESVDSPHGL
jgi:hypothetical protein